MFRFLLISFLLAFLIESYVLIKIGNVIGAYWTICLSVVTAVIGVSMLRWQGLHIFKKARISLAHSKLPAITILEGVILLFSGVMLLTPGFITDTLGFIMLIPTFREGIIKRILAKSHPLHISQNRIMERHEQQEYDGSSVIKVEISNKENNLLR